jgi:hypothetical protein
MGCASRFYACRKNTLHETLSKAKKMEEEIQRRGKGCSAGKSAKFITSRFFFFVFLSQR